MRTSVIMAGAVAAALATPAAAQTVELKVQHFLPAGRRRSAT